MTATDSDTPTVARDVDDELPPELRAVVAAAKKRFREGLPGKLERLEAECRDAGRDLDALVAARRAVHTIAGSGATFGYPRVSDAALEVERQLVSFRGAITPGALEMLERSLRALRDAVAEDERLSP